ncbi:MAG TPA: AI-2E family transporter, partial [Desulfoprunum sp.]|nr:AI-2E family transporter [Desulfoprunum sp.]
HIRLPQLRLPTQRIRPMNTSYTPDNDLEKSLSARLLDVLIRAGLVLAMTMLCYRIFAPFLPLMLWALILAVTMYPIHRQLARRLGGKQGLASTLLVLVSIVLIVAPSSVLISSLGDSTYELFNNVKNNTLQIPAPSPVVADWPIVGKKVHSYWSQVHSDLPAVVRSMQPKIGELAKHSLDVVAGTGGKILQFLFSFIIAGIIMAFGESGARAALEISERIVGTDRGKGFVILSTATIRTVAAGVIGIACIQALLIGLALIIAGIPWAGVLALIALVLGIAQLPAVLVTLPVVGYIWYSGDYSTIAAIGYSALLIVSGVADNVLKPLMLGRGVDAPMPVILLGALGGMATTGILGMFVGATLLALGYQIFMWWVANNPDSQADKGNPQNV